MVHRYGKRTTYDTYPIQKQYLAKKQSDKENQYT